MSLDYAAKFGNYSDNYLIKKDKNSQSGVSRRLDSGESQQEVIRPDFNRAEVASAFPLVHHYRAVLAWSSESPQE
jgi:hypothetical protein